MNKLLVLFLLFFSLLTISAQSNKSGFEIGFSFAAGGKYDAVRQCVATPRGVTGGPAFEFGGLVLDYRFDNWFAFGGYIPLLRPILFGAAFQMLQFMPELIFSLYIPVYFKVDLFLIMGMGGSFHYGPGFDYKGNLVDKPFFAGGPRFSLSFGPRFYINDRFSISVGLKPYFEYLFNSRDGKAGIVGGGEIDFQCRLKLTSNN